MCFLITVHVCTCNFHYFHLRLISNVCETSSGQSVVILGTPLTLTVETLDLEEDFPWRQMAFEKTVFVSGRYKRILLATPSSRMPLKSKYIWLIPWLILHVYIYITYTLIYLSVFINICIHIINHKGLHAQKLWHSWRKKGGEHCANQKSFPSGPYFNWIHDMLND